MQRKVQFSEGAETKAGNHQIKLSWSQRWSEQLFWEKVKWESLVAAKAISHALCALSSLISTSKT